MGKARELFRFVVRALAVLPIRLYQVVLSPWLPPACIYTPSCSHYAREAIMRHGLLRGSAAAVARILRCTGLLFEGGYDPVPERITAATLAAGYSRFRRRRRR
jgi:uncharacterized protein